MESREELIRKLKEIMPSSCINAYKKRNLSAPDCAWCNYGEDIADFIIEDRKKVAIKELEYLLNDLINPHIAHSLAMENRPESLEDIQTNSASRVSLERVKNKIKGRIETLKNAGVN